MIESLSPTVLVVFGTTGDLMARKIVPALFHLHERELLPESMCIVGFGRREWSDEDLRQHVRGILSEAGTSGEPSDFIGMFEYQQGQFDDPASYLATADHLKQVDDRFGTCANKLFYLAVPPEHYATIFRRLAESGLTKPCSESSGWTRVLVEKPFGDDEETARELDGLLGSLFREEQIYRIDHYLAKEMLQGVINFRFANNLFEREWDREGVERIDISLLEEMGVERRGAFYDRVGALRDVGQNHLLQMLALVAMDQPASLASADIRDARARLIESLAPMTVDEVADRTFRAQYEGYQDVSGVAAGSETETYFRLRTALVGPRWAGVPVTMEAGKRMGQSRKRIVVRLRHPAPCLCTPGMHQTNKIVFTLEPDESIEIVFYAKKPGIGAQAEERRFSFFLYQPEEDGEYGDEYAKLLYDAVCGDQTLFVSTREVEASWRFIDSIVDGWRADAVPLATYAPDTDEISYIAAGALAQKGRRGQVGVVGLGKMGAGLARNLLDHHWTVVGYNRTHATAEAMRGEGLVPVESLPDLVGSLDPPRSIWLMLTAGKAVESVLFGADGSPGLADLLSPGDVVIDGGNSHFTEAPTRAERLAEKGVRFLDCGTSGGPAGARFGACLMIGGERESFERLEPMFADVSARGAYRFFDGHGAGHFVKMVHNGIEYGMMQAIAEGFEVLHASPYGLDLEEVADLYQHRSVIESRLVGWLEDQYSEYGSDLDGVSPIVGHSGEAAWTIEVAEEFGIPVPVIEGSLTARVESEIEPRYSGRVLTALRDAFGGHGLGPGGGPRA